MLWQEVPSRFVNSEGRIFSSDTISLICWISNPKSSPRNWLPNALPVSYWIIKFVEKNIKKEINNIHKESIPFFLPEIVTCGHNANSPSMQLIAATRTSCKYTHTNVSEAKYISQQESKPWSTKKQTKNSPKYIVLAIAMLQHLISTAHCNKNWGEFRK